MGRMPTLTSETRVEEAPPEAPRRRLRGPRLRRPGAPALLLAALLAALAYAAFANGATALPDETRLHVGLALATPLALAALLFGGGLRARAPAAAWAGLALLAGFAAWTGISLAWSTAPDLTWAALDRAIAYALVATLAVVLGASLPRAPERVALGYVAVAVAVALYALGGKAMPWLELPGVFDLNHTADFSRLRAPLGYWNALALVCVLAVPLALRAAADPERRRVGGLALLLALVPLLATVALSYSRGGIAVLVLSLAVLVALGPGRVRLLAFGAVAAAGALPALVVAFVRDDLTDDGLSIAARTDDGFLFLAALVLGLAATVAAGLWLRRNDERLVLGERGRRRALRAAGAVAAAALVLTAGALALSERGLTGTISHEVESFTSLQEDRQDDPSRLLQTSSGNRWVWWNEAGGAFWDRPLLGHGGGTFPLVHLAYRDNEIQVRQAHSVPLQFLAELGLPGALLALGGLGLLALAAGRRIRAARGRERGYAAALGAACAGWGLHMWVDWDWEIPAATLPLLVFLGVLAATPPQARATAPPEPPGEGDATGGRAALLALGTALACAFAVSALLPALARERTSDALVLAGQGTPGALVEAAASAEEARRLNPLAVEPVFAAATVAERRGRYEEASELLAEAVRRQPANPQSWLRIAAFQLKRDDSPRAVAAAAAVLRLDPEHDFAPFFAFHGDPGARSATATGTPLPERRPTVLNPGAVPPAADTPAAP
jgi:tetratricopeptide (TPR) repeat protein